MKILEIFVHEFAIPVAEVVLPILAAIAINEARKWLNTTRLIKENESLRYELEALATDAIGYAEEIAHQMRRISGEKLPGKKKEEMALNYLLETAKQHNLTVERARKLILTTLGNKYGRHGKD